MKPKLQTVQIRKHFLSPALLFANFRKSTVPEGGWTHEAFLSPAGAQLIRDLLSVQNAAKLKGARMLSVPLAKVMKAQVLNVIAIFESKITLSYGTRAAGKEPQLRHSTLTLSSRQHEDLWAAAIEDAFAKEGHTVLATVRAPLQSVADDVLEKTTTLLNGGKPQPGTRRTLQMDMNEMSKEVTNINETTRKNLSRIIRKGIDDGESPFALMETVRNKLPQIATNRVPTIVRTEMGRAVDRATIRSFKEGGEVTHVSVIGCQAIEKGIPTFDGVPTCNIKNVPIEFASSLRFHPNHTGAIVASGFKSRDGGRPPLPLRSGAPIGTWEDRGRPVPALFNEQPPGPAGGGPAPPSITPSPPAAPPVVPPVKPIPPAKPVEPVKPPLPDLNPVKEKITKAIGPLERRSPGGLQNGWVRPKDHAGIIQLEGEMDFIGMRLYDEDYNRLSDLIANRPNDAAYLVQDFEKIFKMSPTDLENHIFAGIDRSSFSQTSLSVSVLSDKKAKINGKIVGHDGGITTFTRAFNMDSSRGRLVDHEYFKVHSGNQKADLGKKLSKQFLSLYDHMEIDVISIHANIDVGGYAWARYGFIPEAHSWPDLTSDIVRRWKQVRDNGRSSFPAAVEVFAPEEIAKLDAFFESVGKSKNPLDVRKVAALKQTLTKPEYDPATGNYSKIKESTIGKEILLGTDWYGKITLTKSDDYTIYRKYIE